MRYFIIVTALMFLSVIACEASTPNLLMHLSFDEGEDVGIVNLAGKDYGFKNDGGKWVNGKKHKAIDFDGESNIRVDAMGVKLDGFTIDFWLKPAEGVESITSRQDIIYQKSGDSGLHLKFTQGNQPLVLNIVLENGNSLTVTGQTNEWTSRWYHIAFVQDELKAAIYIDGELDGEVNTNSPPVFTYGDAGLAIGGRGAKFAGFFEGCIDEFRIWSKAFAEDGIQGLLSVSACEKLIYLWGEIKSVSQ